MHLTTIGLSHHTAPIAVRERVAFSASRVRWALQEARRLPGVREAAIVSTCNRTEIYSVGDTPDEGPLIDFLCRDINAAEVRNHLYFHHEESAARHLFRVASGADSMVLGEGQILGQVREAARMAVEESSAGAVLRRMFDQAVVCGRRVRTETDIARGAVSVSHVAVDLARQIFGNLNGKSVLLLGAGETAELTARQMARYGVTLLMVANRTFERAETLAQTLGGRAVKYDEYPERMVNADIVVSSTAAPHAVIHAAAVRAAAARRKGRPMFLIDLAVPRDIEPDVGEIDDVFLYNMDDLQAMVGENLRGRRMELETVDAIIDEEVTAFLRWVASLQTAPVLSGLQSRFEEIRQAEIARTERRLAGLTVAERKAVDQMTRAMVKKMLHEPWRYLRAHSGTAEAATALQAMVDIFDLEGVGAPEDAPEADEPTTPDALARSGVEGA